MPRLLIIADDFTGALDTGVQFAVCGADIRVTTAASDLEAIPTCEVLVVDAETRHLSASDAYYTVKEIVTQAVLLGIPYIYKKTDSALRGNIGAELTALLHASGERQLPFLPAFPKMGRITKMGVHYMDDVPVAQSVFGHDPFEPVRHSDIPQLIAEQSDVPVLCSPPLQNTVPTPDGNGIIVFDAVDDANLVSTGRRLLEDGRLRIMAGCAGFGAVIPSLLGLGRQHMATLPELQPQLLVICGSVNPITLEQLDAAEKAGFLRIRLTPEQKLNSDYWLTERGVEDFHALRDALKMRSRRIIDTNDIDGNFSTAEYAEAHGMTAVESRMAVAHAVGYIVSQLFSSFEFGTLLVTGGDTLLQCMDYMDIHELQPLCEMDPGVVLSRFTYQGCTRYVISKSGGFGDAHLLNRIVEQIRKKQNK